MPENMPVPLGKQTLFYFKPKRGFACTNSDIDPNMIIQLFILQTN